MIVFRCDREGCKAEAPAATKSGAKPALWTIGMGKDLCPKCSATGPTKGDRTVIGAAAREEKRA